MPALTALAALAACFNPGDPGESQSSRTTSVGTSTATTEGTTGETTTTETATGETTAGETSSGGMTSTGGGDGEPHAFRITQLDIIDPHAFYAIVENGPCSDVTPILNSWINSEIENGDFSQAVVLSPSTLIDGAEMPLILTNASCNVALDTCSQLSQAGDMPVESTAINVDKSGICSIQVNGTWNPLYAESGVPNVSNWPCFTSAESAGSLRIATGDNLPAIELKNVRIAAAYVAAPVEPEAAALVSGTIRGYLTRSAAVKVQGVVSDTQLVFNLWGAIGGGEGCQQDPEEPIDDTDPNPDVDDPEPGAWLYLNFEATRVQWL
ncbi:MAG TPA: hypothetical protein ENK31_02605 [Nannocystis exedens]|nr:hypothetical protein [Nannocystis exedens]